MRGSAGVELEMVFLPELYEYFGLTANGGGITTRSRFLSHTVAGQNPGTSLNFFPPRKKKTQLI